MRELGYERAFRRWMEERGMPWEPLRYPRPGSGGETMAYRLSPAGPPRATMLVVHGAGNDALFGFIGLFKALLGCGLEIFSFDLDGHGRGGSARFHPEAVRDAVAEAVRRSGAGDRGLAIHALGVSLGGAVLLGALPALSPPIASAILLVAPLHIHFSGAAVRNELRASLLRTVWRERVDHGLLGLVPSFGPFRRGTYPLRLAVAPAEGSFGYVGVLNDALGGMALEEAARRVRVPVLLVYGTDDRIVPAEQGEHLARLIPRAELLMIAGGTHLTTPLAPAARARVVEWVT